MSLKGSDLFLRKRYYIMFVARDEDGQLLKIPIPIHYLYVFVAGAVIGMKSTGIATIWARCRRRLRHAGSSISGSLGLSIMNSVSAILPNVAGRA